MRIEAGGHKGAGRRRARARTAACLAFLALALPAPGHAVGIVQIQTPSIVLSPTIDDYANDYVEATGPFGIRIRAKNTGHGTGFTIMVRCADVAPDIAVGDLMLRAATPAGPGGTSMAVYTPVTPVSQTLWSSGNLQQFVDIDVDVRIRNLFNYAADPFFTPTLTNTLVFTIVEP